MWDYRPGFIKAPDEAFKALSEELAWVKMGNTPRQEYYVNATEVPYTYGAGRGVRTYQPQPWHPVIRGMREQLLAETGVDLDVCFLNRYMNQSDSLGWHADDSPEMDDGRPIAIISLGVEREIWFRPNEDPAAVTRLVLQHGSLCLMQPGMQDQYQHRIPKAGFMCGERISLTYRGYTPMPSGA